jgi:hypothetical protein
MNKKNISDQEYLTNLHQLLMSHFDQEELKTLCFNLGANYDSLRGEGMMGKTRELVLYMKRQGLIAELANEIAKFRPHIALSDLFQTTPPQQLLTELLLSNRELQTFRETGIDQDDIELYIQDLSRPTYLRLIALQAYIMDGLSNQVMFNSLANDLAIEVRQTMLRYVFENPNPDNEIEFEAEYLEKLIHSEVSDEVVAVAIKAARHLVKKGKIPLKFLTTVKNHKYWLVRKIAISYIANIDTPDVLELLYEFRTTSYHASQQIIRDFIQRHYRNLNEVEWHMAIEIVQGLLNAKVVSEISKRKNMKLLTQLKNEQALK